MKTARITSLLLAALMLLSTVSCASGGNETKDTDPTNAVTTEPETTAAPEPYYLDVLSDKTFDGTTFTMIGEDYEQRPNFCQEEMTGNVINDVVYERHMALETRYKVNIEYNSQPGRKDCNNAVKDAIAAQDDTYDLVFNSMTSGANNLILDGGVVDMATLPYLDFTKPWWSQTMLKDFNYKGHTYLAVGGSSPSYYLSASVTLFNVDEAKTYGLPDMYALVKEGKWTVDKMGELMSISKKDINGDGVIDVTNDFFPLVFSSEVGRNLYVSAGGEAVLRTEDGGFALNIGSKNSIDILDKLHGIFADKTNTFVQDGSSAKIAEFTSGHTMFAMTAMMFANMELRGMEDLYGVLPLPKLDEAQKDYITCGNPFAPCGMLIPRTVTNTEMSALIAEAMGFLGEEIVRPGVYNVTLHGKLAQDEQSSEMLELIYRDIVFDLCACYEFKNISKRSREYVTGKIDNFASVYAENEAAAQQALKDMVDALEQKEKLADAQ